MISQAESVLHLCLAAGASTAMFGAGLLRRRGRGRRWTWLAGGVVGAAMTAYVADAELRGYSNPSAAIPLALAALAGVVVGAFLLRVGLRGRRVGDHEYCRRCGFDLFGRPAGTRVCGECGTSLDAPRAIVVGVRHRRPVPLLVGCFALVLSLALSVPLGRDGVAWARRYDWRERWWPESWLLAELKSPSPIVRDQAAGYLAYREGRSRLSPGARSELIDALLSPTFNGTTNWASNAPWALDLVVSSWRRGRADEAEVRRVMQRALDLHLELAPNAARGRTLRHWFALAGLTDQPVARVDLSDRRDALDGRAVGPATRSTLAQFAERNGGGYESTADNALLLPTDLPLGPATLTTRLTATMTLAVPGRPTLVESRDLVLTGTTTIVEPDAMRCPPATMPANFLPDVTLDREDPAHVLLRVGLPWSAGGVAILADVALRPRGGAERALGPVYADVNVQASIDLGPLPPGFYDVILRPRPDLGAELFAPVPIVADEMLVPVPGQR